MIWKVKLMRWAGGMYQLPARTGTRLDYGNGNKQESCGKQLGGRWEKTSGRQGAVERGARGTKVGHYTIPHCSLWVWVLITSGVTA
jgi:hypothetical protein